MMSSAVCPSPAEKAMKVPEASSGRLSCAGTATTFGLGQMERVLAAGVDHRDGQLRRPRQQFVDDAVAAVAHRKAHRLDAVLVAGIRGVGGHQEVLAPVAPAMAGIGEEHRVAGGDAVVEGEQGIGHRPPVEVERQRHLEAHLAQKRRIAAGIGHRLVQRRQLVIGVVADDQGELARLGRASGEEGKQQAPAGAGKGGGGTWANGS